MVHEQNRQCPAADLAHFSMSSGLSEASLRWHSWLKRWYVPAITPEGDSLEFFSHTEDITGPYEPLVVYKLPEPWGNMTDYYCYAGKAHPELGRASNEMIRYVCNTMDPDALFQPVCAGPMGTYRGLHAHFVQQLGKCGALT